MLPVHPVNSLAIELESHTNSWKCIRQNMSIVQIFITTETSWSTTQVAHVHWAQVSVHSLSKSYTHSTSSPDVHVHFPSQTVPVSQLIILKCKHRIMGVSSNTCGGVDTHVQNVVNVTNSFSVILLLLVLTVSIMSGLSCYQFIIKKIVFGLVKKKNNR